MHKQEIHVNTCVLSQEIIHRRSFLLVNNIKGNLPMHDYR